MIRPTSLSLRALTRHARLAVRPQTVIRSPVVLAARTTRAHSSASASAPKTSPMQPAAEAPGSFTPTPLATTMTSAAYDRLATETMDTLYDACEALVEEWSPEGTHGWEVEYSSGVLTLALGPHGTYVINKQPPNQQIWMSSPFSGPARFSYAPEGDEERGARWYYARDQVTLGSVLDQEIRSVLVAEVGERDAQAWRGSGVP